MYLKFITNDNQLGGFVFAHTTISYYLHSNSSTSFLKEAMEL